MSAIIDIWQNDQELIAAQPRHLRLVSRYAAKPCGGSLEQLVANPLPQGFIDLLEPIKIDHHQGAGLLGVAEQTKCLFNLGCNMRAIGQSGQRVVADLLHAPHLLVNLHCHVARTSAISSEVAGEIEVRLACKLPPDWEWLSGWNNAVTTDRITCRQEEGKRAFNRLFISIGRQKLVSDRRIDYLCRIPIELFQSRFREIGKVASFISCPKKAQSGLLKTVKQLRFSKCLCHAFFARQDIAHFAHPRGRLLAASTWHNSMGSPTSPDA